MRKANEKWEGRKEEKNSACHVPSVNDTGIAQPQSAREPSLRLDSWSTQHEPSNITGTVYIGDGWQQLVRPGAVSEKTEVSGGAEDVVMEEVMEP